MVLTVLVVSFSARVDTKNIPQSAYMLRLNYERLRGTRITTKVFWSALNSIGLSNLLFVLGQSSEPQDRLAQLLAKRQGIQC